MDIFKSIINNKDDFYHLLKILKKLLTQKLY